MRPADPAINSANTAITVAASDLNNVWVRQGRAAAVLGAIGAAVMFALMWLVGGHFPKS